MNTLQESPANSVQGAKTLSLSKSLLGKNFAIGLSFGMAIGALNAYMLGLPFFPSVIIGGALGLVVSTLGSHQYMQARIDARRMRVGENSRVRATSAFSTFD